MGNVCVGRAETVGEIGEWPSHHAARVHAAAWAARARARHRRNPWRRTDVGIDRLSLDGAAESASRRSRAISLAGDPGAESGRAARKTADTRERARCGPQSEFSDG